MRPGKASVFHLIASISLLLLLACSEKKEMPAEIMKMENMIQIQADVELIESYLITVRLKTERDSVAVIKFNELYEKHGISREDYQRSLQYYRDDKVLLRELYTKTLEKLKRRETELKAQKDS